jgi:hypothetical protein
MRGLTSKFSRRKGLLRLTHLPFWIRGPNIILRRHLGAAREPAFGAAQVKFGWLKCIRRWIISPLGICSRLMSAFGTKRTSQRYFAMSAFGGKAYINRVH